MSALNTPTPGGIFADIEQWVRRIIKAPNVQSITSKTIGDYVNRFYVYEAPQRLQLFELKRQYTFETIPNIFEYQFDYTNYQNLLPPVYVDGVQIGFFQSNEQFYKLYPELVLNEQPIMGNSTTGPYTLNVADSPLSIPNIPPFIATRGILRAFVDDLGNRLPYVYITYTDVNSYTHFIVDSGTTSVANANLGILIETDSTFQTILGPSIVSGGSGTVNYLTGVCTFTTLADVMAGSNINTQCSPYSSGVPRIALFFNNTIKMYPVPDRTYKVQFDTYITPAQFLTTTSALQFSYMAEWIARGAARKILTDNVDMDQFNFYEPLFREQENLVLRRTSRQNSTQRTPTIFSSQTSQNPYLYTQY
jgi:hypothetical protein